MSIQRLIPVIDLFAGPGGLNEGFSYPIAGESRFKSVLSVEKEAAEHQTLSLRSFYRYFLYKGIQVPKEYYDYIQKLSSITRKKLWTMFPEAAASADSETLQFTLGHDDDELLEKKIRNGLNATKNWLLIGGPPCQAYSLVGRSKSIGEFKKTWGTFEDASKKFDEDPRHKLYRQYLKILAMHSPAVFVMENVQGILSAKFQGDYIFPKILKDLSAPSLSVTQYGWSCEESHTYHIVSFVTGKEPHAFSFKDFLIESEKYGIPQARHRVILLGIRDDIWNDIGGSVKHLIPIEQQTTVGDAIYPLPPLRSRFSKGIDSTKRWKDFLATFSQLNFFNKLPPKVKTSILDSQCKRISFSAETITSYFYVPDTTLLHGWYNDPLLTRYLNHEPRSHMESDLYRYLFVSSVGEVYNSSPKLHDFPEELLPNHKNVKSKSEDEIQKFADRFKVQLKGKPSSTITSHISKDGHYFIHPDPVQCRSLTVREAARLQTFPDNYFFEGNRTEQYHQVGNAVPPYLAHLLAEIVYDIFLRIKH